MSAFLTPKSKKPMIRSHGLFCFPQIEQELVRTYD